MSTFSRDNRRPPRSQVKNSPIVRWLKDGFIVVIIALIVVAGVANAPKPLSAAQIEPLKPAAREAYYAEVELEAEAHQACVDAGRKDAGCAGEAVKAALKSVR
ncbi:MAG: hypothetical protein ACKVOE_07615 [Rickettsiales bacterium]